MKLFLHIALVIALGLVVQLFYPFWGLVVSAFVIGLLYLTPTGPRAFLAGLIGGLILWGGMAYYQQLPNDGQLTQQIADLMEIGNKWILLLGTALLGGILAGLGSMTGHYFRGLWTTSS
jgi:hypothetical protein